MKLPVSESALCFEGVFIEDDPEVEAETASELILRDSSIGAHHCNQCDKSFPCRCDSHRHHLFPTRGKSFCCAECSARSLNLDADEIYPREVYGRHINHNEVSTTQPQTLSGSIGEHSEYTPSTQSLESSSRFPPQLKALLRSHTKEKPFSCAECSKTFKTKGNLTQHQRIHNGERPFICDECGAKFRQQHHLTAHQVLHTGAKPWICPECGRAFPQASGLSYHRSAHTGKRPHQCTECSKKFISSSDLIRHMRKHTGEKPYRCEKCDKNYTKSSTLRKHMLKHTGTADENLRDVSFTGSDSQTPS